MTFLLKFQAGTETGIIERVFGIDFDSGIYWNPTNPKADTFCLTLNWSTLN